MKLTRKGNFCYKKSIILVGFAVILSSLWGCGSLEKTTVKKIIVTRKGVFHTVARGQTVYRIARAYGVDPKAILKINRISDPKKLKVGRKLFIPGAVRHVAVKSLSGWKGKRGKAPPFRRRKNVKIKPGYFAWPIKGIITSKFGLRKGRPHDGIDIAGKEGVPIRAAAPGKVVFSDWGPTGYGRLVIVRHSADLVTVYAHNKKNLAPKGRVVKKGEKIALLGQTGRATGPHLHFEVRADRESVDPLKYLP